MLNSTFDLLKRVAAISRREVPEASPFEATRPFSGPAVPAADLIFRLKAWPQLPEAGRTAEVYRMLSVMSSRPVNRQWLLARCRMAPKQLDTLLMKLAAEGSLEVINPARFARA
jgi:hypothetical protein